MAARTSQPRMAARGSAGTVGVGTEAGAVLLAESFSSLGVMLYISPKSKRPQRARTSDCNLLGFIFSSLGDSHLV